VFTEYETQQRELSDKDDQLFKKNYHQIIHWKCTEMCFNPLKGFSENRDGGQHQSIDHSTAFIVVKGWAILL